VLARAARLKAVSIHDDSIVIFSGSRFVTKNRPFSGHFAQERPVFPMYAQLQLQHEQWQ